VQEKGEFGYEKVVNRTNRQLWFWFESQEEIDNISAMNN